MQMGDKPSTLMRRPFCNLQQENIMKALYVLAAVAGLYLPTSAAAQIPLQTLRACLDIEDQSKERLDCYDEKVAPAPKQVSAPAKKVDDCRFVKEEDERLNCFNRFVNPPPKKNTAQKRKTP
jgi:hypothetical protein